MVIKVPTSDCIAWNLPNVIADICSAMSRHEPILLDLIAEGPALMTTGLYDHLEYCSQQFEYDLSNITIETRNSLEYHPKIKIVYEPPHHFLNSVKENTLGINTAKDIKKHFGIFIGRSNAPRLLLSSWLHSSNKAVQSFHYTPKSCRNDVGIEGLINDLEKRDIANEVNFLSLCPIVLNDAESLYPNWNNQAYGKIYPHYLKFFVEIVCETCYTSSGTFFPTEKTWRPIAMKTPFIIQGPQYYIKRLQSLGFKTFTEFWDEGYDNDPARHAPFEIIKVLEYLEKKTHSELVVMYNEMMPILEHNYNVFIELTKDDFFKIK